MGGFTHSSSLVVLVRNGEHFIDQFVVVVGGDSPSPSTSLLFALLYLAIIALACDRLRLDEVSLHLPAASVFVTAKASVIDSASAATTSTAVVRLLAQYYCPRHQCRIHRCLYHKF